jgi:hypothetical protein
VLPLPVFVAEKVGTSPTTGLLAISLRVMVTVELATPSATTGPVPTIDEFAAAAAPPVNVTVPSVFVTGVVMLRVLISALVDCKVHVEDPLESVDEHDP